MREHLAGVRDERGEQPELDRCQVHRVAGARDVSVREVDLHVAEHDGRRLRARAAIARRRSARARAREQLGDAERLRQVVVGAGVERLDLVVLLGACREHDDRQRRRTRAGRGSSRRRRRRAARGRESARSGLRVPASISAALDRLGLVHAVALAPRAPVRTKRRICVLVLDDQHERRSARVMRPSVSGLRPRSPAAVASGQREHEAGTAARARSRRGSRRRGPRRSRGRWRARGPRPAAARFAAAARELVEDRVRRARRQSRAAVVDRDLARRRRTARAAMRDRRARRRVLRRHSRAG